METKCGVCEKGCSCKTCKKNIDCRYSTQEDCKVCVECGRYEPFDYIKEIFRELDRPRGARKLQDVFNLKRAKLERWADNGNL